MVTRTLRVCGLIGLVSLPASAQLLFGPAATTDYEPFSSAFVHSAAGDVDGDGFADLVYGQPGAPTLRLGDGTGRFGAESPIDTDVMGESLVLADMNGDAVLDLVAGTMVLGQFVALGAGDGSFGAATAYTTGGSPTLANALTLTAGDADGDGDVDIVAVRPGGIASGLGEARMFRNLGNGVLGMVGVVPTQTFATPKVVRAFPVNLNGDARPDMVVIRDDGFQFPIFSAAAMLCQGDGTFVTSWSTSVDMPMRAADLDADGDQDLVTWPLVPLFGPPPAQINAWLNAGDGTFVAGPSTPASAPNGLSLSSLDDLDADGIPDLALVAQYPADLWVLRGAGDGSFETPGAYVSLSDSVAGGSPQLADFDGDGRLDLTCSLGFTTATPFQAVSLNRTYPGGAPLLDLGGQLEGTAWPIQIAAGAFAGGQPFTFTLAGGVPTGVAYHVVGLSLLAAPFKGGTMLPLPFLITGPWPISAQGTLSIAGTWPSGPSGLHVIAQFWLPDANGPAGFSASSGVQVVTP